jgi:dihydroflavonol-4-reductase
LADRGLRFAGSNPLKPTLVTGATGFIGWHVARLLIEKGHRVRALVRTGAVKDLPVECVTGDLRDPGSLARAVSGCGAVFHVAADYRLWSPKPEELFASNEGGTANLLAAAQSAGVDRMVYTSTVGTIGFNGPQAGTEESVAEPGQMEGAYKRSKYQAEQRVLKAAQSGFPVVIVNPTAPVGDHDFKPTPTGRIIVDYLKGNLPAFVDTGLNFVDVRDVAIGHWLAFEQGRPGERYILGCENLTLEGVFQRLAKVSGRPAPTVKIPYAAAFLAGVVTTAWADLTGVPPVAPLEGVRMSRKKMWVSHAKASRSLGYHPGPVDRALKAAVDWFRDHRYA